MAVVGYKQRAFAAAVISTLLLFGFLFAVMVGGPLSEFLIKSAKVPALPARLGSFIVIMGAIYGGGQAIANQYWLNQEIRLLKSIDELLGGVIGFCGGMVLAGSVCLFLFTYSGLDVAFYPPENLLDENFSWDGPDPIFHTPYRAMQLVSSVDRLTGGKGIDPGPAGARLVGGDVGEKFYRTLAFAEEHKESAPFDVLREWDKFQDEYKGKPYKIWNKRVDKERKGLKNYVGRRNAEANKYLAEVFQSRDIDKIRRALSDIESYAEEHDRLATMFEQASEAADLIEEAREIAEQNPGDAIGKLQKMVQKLRAGSHVSRLLTSEIRSIKRGGGLPDNLGSDDTTSLSIAEQESRKSIKRFRFTKAISLLKKCRSRLRKPKDQDRVSGLLDQANKIADLHDAVIKVIRGSDDIGKPLPARLDFGEGAILKDVNANFLTIEVKGIPSPKSWSTLGADKVRRIYVHYLGEEPEGLEDFDSFFFKD